MNWIIPSLLTILYPIGFKCSFIWPSPWNCLFSMLPPLPLLLPLSLLMLRPCPSSPRHILMPLAVVHMTVHGPVQAIPGLPLASPCSCHLRVVCPWEEGSPCPNAHTRSQHPKQQTNHDWSIDWVFHLRASTQKLRLAVTMMRPDR